MCRYIPEEDDFPVDENFQSTQNGLNRVDAAIQAQIASLEARIARVEAWMAQLERKVRVLRRAMRFSWVLFSVTLAYAIFK